MSRPLNIAEANTRLATTWKNTETTWEDFTNSLKDPHISPTTCAQYQQATKTRQADIKDVGGYVAGLLSQGRRKAGHVQHRSIIALDADQPEDDFLTRVQNQHLETFIYTTCSSTPEAPRYRVLIPLEDDVTAEQYEAIARRIAADIGIDEFDDTTYQPHRLMYRPVRLIDGDYTTHHYPGAWVNPKTYLDRYHDWRDITAWPTSSRQTNLDHTRADQQADPLTKPGIIGAFCRAHTIQDTIATHLNTIYTPGAHDDRYTYAKGESANGLVIYDNKFAYSHHGTDPAGGRLHNAFDLVRIHLYGTDDVDAKPGTPTTKLPSYQRMADLASNDQATKKVLAEDTRKQLQEDFGTPPTTHNTNDKEDTDNDWLTQLSVTKNGRYEDTLANLTIICTHDPGLKEIRYNLLSETIDVRDPRKLPWHQPKPGWTDTDLAQLKLHLERTYRLYSTTKTQEALAIAAAARAYHPVRDYLDDLPQWDGTPRVDTLLVDVLGAEDTNYVRAVTRKTLVAACMRVMRPGCKFDQVLILSGPQGTGKSTLFTKLGKQWFSDALTLTDMRDKTAAEKLQGYWINEVGELAGIKKMEVEVIKGFISRTHDKYRAAYARTVEDHPRQGIIVGSTNAEDGFLRDVTGNRRFWPVTITGNGTLKSWDLTDEFIDQVWAEALHYTKTGEQLHLTGELAEQARQHQDAAIETDERVGMVEAYLDTPVPPQWWDWSTQQRRQYLAGDQVADPTAEFGELGTPVPRDAVTAVEIFAECFGEDPGRMLPRDSYSISAIMQKIPGWEKPSGAEGRVRVYPYGRQRAWRNVDAEPPF